MKKCIRFKRFLAMALALAIVVGALPRIYALAEPEENVALTTEALTSEGEDALSTLAEDPNLANNADQPKAATGAAVTDPAEPVVNKFPTINIPEEFEYDDKSLENMKISGTISDYEDDTEIYYTKTLEANYTSVNAQMHRINYNEEGKFESEVEDLEKKSSMLYILAKVNGKIKKIAETKLVYVVYERKQKLDSVGPNVDAGQTCIYVNPCWFKNEKILTLNATVNDVAGPDKQGDTVDTDEKRVKTTLYEEPSGVKNVYWSTKIYSEQELLDGSENKFANMIMVPAEKCDNGSYKAEVKVTKWDSNELYFYAEDNNGNFGASVPIAKIEDGDAPTVTGYTVYQKSNNDFKRIVDIIKNKFFGTAIDYRVIINAEDKNQDGTKGSGIQSVELLDPDKNSVSGGYDPNFKAYVYYYSFAKDVDLTGFSVKLTDKVGNTATEELCEIQRDNGAPTISITNDADKVIEKKVNNEDIVFVKDDDFNVNIEISDPVSGIGDYSIVVRGEEPLKKQALTVKDANEVVTDVVKTINEKINVKSTEKDWKDKKYIEVTAIDNAGVDSNKDRVDSNKAEDKAIYVVDNDAPSIKALYVKTFGKTFDDEDKDEEKKDDTTPTPENPDELTTDSVDANNWDFGNSFGEDTGNAGKEETVKGTKLSLYSAAEAPAIKVYEFFSNDTDAKFTVETSDDVGIGTKKLYYKFSDEEEFTAVDVVDEKAEFTVRKNFKGYLILKAEDELGNGSKELVSGGVILETQEAHNALEEAYVTYSVNPAASHKDVAENDLYNKGDLPVTVTVNLSETFAGLSSFKVELVTKSTNEVISCETVEITGNGEINTGENNPDEKKPGDIFNGESKNNENSKWTVKTKDSNLATAITGSFEVTCDYNDINVFVTTSDNCDNKSEGVKVFSIDTTAPVATIAFKNNEGDATYPTYFKADRPATISVQERNFDEKLVKINITNTDGKIPAIGKYSPDKVANPTNETTYTTDILFSEDGDYTVECSLEDMAGNVGESFPKESFTIDKTKPVVTVDFDNKDARNSNYYKAARTATITVVEHNFDQNRMVISGKSTEDGAAITFPSCSSWTSAGKDTYTATIKFDHDGTYEFTVKATDKAGNESELVSVPSFIVDLTLPEVTISGIEDMSANSGVVAPVVTLTDNNFDAEGVTITLVGSNRGNVSLDGSYSTTAKGQQFAFKNFEEIQAVDDLYTLTATEVDKAGNEYTETIQFSVNRFGSVYTLGKDVKSILGTYTKNAVDVEITETNVNSLAMDTIQVVVSYNGTPVTLKEGTDYKVSEGTTSSRWCQYTYKINKSYFDQDGTYSVALYSVDAAGNKNQNTDDSKKAVVNFGIDTTNPVIVPINIEDNTEYDASTYMASVSVNDNLVLENVEVKVNGKTTEFETDGDNYTVPVEGSNSRQTIEVVATDAAGNSVVYTAKNVVVSTNAIVRLYYNKVAFAATCAALVAGIALIVLAIVLASRKKKTN